MIDDIRAREYARLDNDKSVYLDYAGSSLYSNSQIANHAKYLTSHLLASPSSVRAATEVNRPAVEQQRERLLRLFGADPAEYALVFCSGAAHANRIVGECYPFAPDSQLLLTVDNHCSVHSTTHLANLNHAQVRYLRQNSCTLETEDIEVKEALDGLGNRRGLFVFPAQSSISGVRHPLTRIAQAQAKGWHVMVDMAAFAPTSPLNLSRYHPEFVSISFHKMFGWPNGVGALLVKRSIMEQMHSYNSNDDSTEDATSGFNPADCESETPNYLNIPSLAYGLDLLNEASYEAVSLRTTILAEFLYSRLARMKHHNGQKLVRLYGPENRKNCGPTVAMSFLDNQGQPLDSAQIGQMAAEQNIAVHVGNLINHQACTKGLVNDDLLRASAIVRASLGIVSNFPDVYHFCAFARSLCV